MLIQHLEKLIIRIQNRHSTINYYTKRIFQKYPLETHLAKVYLKNFLEMDIQDADIGYLVIYLASAIESCCKKVSILVISNYNASFLFNLQQIVSNRIGIILDKIDIVPLYLYESRREEFLLQYDIFLTTEKEVIFQGKKFIYLNSILDIQEIKELGEQIYSYTEEYKNKSLEILKMKYVFSDHVVSSKNTKKCIEDILGEFFIVLNENTCFNTLNDNTLFISMFDFEQRRSEIWEISLDYTIEYSGKNICRIIFVIYSRAEKSIIDFYSMVAEMLKPRAFDKLKKKKGELGHS